MSIRPLRYLGISHIWLYVSYRAGELGRLMSALKKDNMNVRIAEDELDLLKRAAESCGKSLSGFVLEAAVFSAQKTLMDQRFMYLDADVFDDVLRQVSQPAKVHPKLAAVMKAGDTWATSKR